MFELAIFDCDGVLVDSEPTANRVMAEVITEAGLPITAEECMRLFMGRRWEDSVSLIAERLGGPLPPSFGDDYRELRDESFRRELEPVAGIADAIARIPLERCVASSGTDERIRFVLGLTGLLELFEGRIFSAHEVEHGKPAPDLFLHAAEQTGHDPERCAVIEDSRVGIEAGVAAGMSVFGYCGHLAAETVRATGARPFASMAELPGLLAAQP